MTAAPTRSTTTSSGVRNAEPGTPGQRGAVDRASPHASENQIVAQNLIGRCDNVGVFPVLRPERQNAGNGRDHKIYNNLFTRCDKGGIVFLDEKNEADGNVYAQLPEKFAGLAQGETIQWLALPAWQARGWDRRGAVAAVDVSFDPDRLELTMSGQAAPAVDLQRIDDDFAAKTPQRCGRLVSRTPNLARCEASIRELRGRSAMRKLTRRLFMGTSSAALMLARRGSAHGPPASAREELRYLRPASTWNEALPIGNGRLGAMIFGRIAQERLQLNEETLWADRRTRPITRRRSAPFQKSEDCSR
jgi:hypothetical protein